MDNLAPLCSYHNRVNRDNPTFANTRGGVERRGGVPMWVSPGGFPKPNDTHPYGAMRVLFGAGV